jgi:hypothetical protein
MSTQPVTGTFTATANSAAIEINRGYFNISISGTFSSSVQLQRSFDAGTIWLDVGSPYTAGAEAVIHEPEAGVQYRFSNTWTSGTSVIYRISQ